MECYFEPISKCSITDALINTSINDILVFKRKSRYSKFYKKIHSMIYTDTSFENRLIAEAKGKLLVDIFKS